MPVCHEHLSLISSHFPNILINVSRMLFPYLPCTLIRPPPLMCTDVLYMNGVFNRDRSRTGIHCTSDFPASLHPAHMRRPSSDLSKFVHVWKKKLTRMYIIIRGQRAVVRGILDSVKRHISRDTPSRRTLR